GCSSTAPSRARTALNPTPLTLRCPGPLVSPGTDRLRRNYIPMKVTLDLTKLLEEGKITRDEHDRLAMLGAASTGSLAFNILLGFGVVAVSGGAVALVPDAVTGIVLGGIVLGAGLALYAARW